MSLAKQTRSERDWVVTKSSVFGLILIWQHSQKKGELKKKGEYKKMKKEDNFSSGSFTNHPVDLTRFLRQRTAVGAVLHGSAETNVPLRRHTRRTEERPTIS